MEVKPPYHKGRESICEQNPDCYLTQERLSLKNSRAAFVVHVTTLISKIETCIFNSDKVEKSLV